MKPSLLIASLFAMNAVYATAGEISLDVTGCIPGKAVHIALYSSAKSFADDKNGELAFQENIVKAESDVVHVSFTNIPAGKYAIAAYVDANGNGKLDSNFVGRPTELYGFSRDARGAFGPPVFDRAAFEVGNDSVKLTLGVK